jgi:hypothetical protein
MVFHNVLHDYKHLYQANQRTYLNGIVHSHRKTKKGFLTTRDVQCVYYRWHGTHWYNIQVLATHINTGASIVFTAAMIQTFRSARSCGNGGIYTVHPTIAMWPCRHGSLQQWRISIQSCWRMWQERVPCHLWCKHRTSLVFKKNFFSFPVAVNNSTQVGPLVFLL